MELAKNPKLNPFSIYQQIADKIYRMNLIKDHLDLSEFNSQDMTPETCSKIENTITQAILPKINRLLNRSLFDVYQVLYDIDVPEDYIKEKIMSVENTSMIPSLIAFAIIDRLKIRYKNHQLMELE
ncbi:MAG: hypothetical protein P1V18_03440 [Candidatus Gracilibacteria bacterium]|nr:hypothetical protein [Candidatus Gracilibacteria bacterium]